MTVWVALLLAGAVLAWPSRRGRPPLALRPVSSSRRGALRSAQGAGHHGRSSGAAALLSALLRHRRSAAHEAVEDVVLQMVAVMVPALRAGLPPKRVLELTREATPGPAEAHLRLDRMVDAAVVGEPLGRLWQEWARTSGATGLVILSQAWSLSERTGATLADGVATAGAAVRTARDARRAAAAASAGARATMNLLTALPLGGVAVAATVGVGPTRLYSSAPAQGCLVLGGCLLVFGRWWVARLTRAALQPERAG